MYMAREYWEGVRAVEAELAGDSVMLMSLSDPLRGMVGGVEPRCRGRWRPGLSMKNSSGWRLRPR